MPKITGTKGNIVQYELLGVAEVVAELTKKGEMIKQGTDAAVLQAAALIQEEVRESIAGARAEQRSVDTGAFLNSVKVDKVKDAEYTVSSDVEYAAILEYGSSKLMPRSHFTNTVNRNEQKVKEIIEAAVEKEIKS